MKEQEGIVKPEIVPRFRIEGKYYTLDELSKKKLKEIISERVDMAMSALKFKKC